MTLDQVRQAKDKEELANAVEYLCDNMQKMTYGAFIAYRRTIEDRAKALGWTLQSMNEYATDYQTFGIRGLK